MAKLTRKQKAFVHYLMDNPKQPASQAAMQTYDVKDKSVAKSIAHENLTKPDLQNYLAKFDNTAQNTVIEVMNNSSSLKDEPQHASIALKAADSVLDRLHGKATQRVESHSTSVNLNLDLTSITDTQQ